MNQKSDFLIKTAVLAVVFIIIVVVSVLLVLFYTTESGFSQEKTAGIEGDWEGMLAADGMELKIVLHIKKQTDGTLKMTWDSPDQGALGLGVDDMSFKDGTLRFMKNDIEAEFEGKLKENSDTIDGEWKQSGMTIPLMLKKKVPEKPRDKKDR